MPPFSDISHSFRPASQPYEANTPEYEGLGVDAEPF
jgi:hypothetical protein